MGMSEYQKPGMDQKEVEVILAAFFSGRDHQAQRLAEALYKGEHPPLLKARGESLLASCYFSKGRYQKLKALALGLQQPEEKTAIESLLPFYIGHRVRKSKEPKRIQGENLIPNLLFFPVWVNGKKGSFLFDTGAMGTIVNQAFYGNETGPPGPGAKVLALNAFGQELKDNKIAHIKDFAFGGLHFQNKQVMVLPEEYLTFPLNEKKQMTIDGIIGFDIIKKYPWLMDTREGTLRLIEEDERQKGTSPNLFCDFFPLAHVWVNQRKQLLAFDTGANQTVFIKRDETNPLQKGAEGDKKVFAAGGQGQALGGWAENQQLILAGRKKTLPLVPLMENMVPISYHFNIRGILGMDMLENALIEIDFSAHRLAITPYEPV